MAETDQPERPASTQRELPDWVARVGLGSWYFLGFCGAIALLAVIFAASRDITIPLALGIVLAVVLARPM